MNDKAEPQFIGGIIDKIKDQLPKPPDGTPVVVVPMPPLQGTWIDWLKWGVPVLIAVITMFFSASAVKQSIDTQTLEIKQAQEAQTAATIKQAEAQFEQAEATKQLAWQVWIAQPFGARGNPPIPTIVHDTGVEKK